YKGLGTANYMIGDRKTALDCYDLYLAAYPDDEATKKFADSLGPVAGGPAAPAATARPQAASGTHNGPGPGPFRPGFDLRLPFSVVAVNSADVDEFYLDNGPYAGSTWIQPAEALTWGLGLGIDYGMGQGFVFGLDAQYGPSRSQPGNWTWPDPWGGTDVESDSWWSWQIAFLATPGWRFKLGNSFVIEPCVSLGVMPAWLNASFDTSYSAQGQAPPYNEKNSNVSYQAYGLGYAIEPQIKAEYIFGRFGFGLSVGYLYNTPTTLKYTSVSNPQNAAYPTGLKVGNTVTYYPSVAAQNSNSPKNWAMNTSGISGSFYVSYYFNPLF
ncbi:MAG TPA: hypothetical protein VK786_07115, partial [bacterium]|nr:hypothetical protein [bacterium]